MPPISSDPGQAARAFALHAVPVGAGLLAISPLPGREGALQQDLRQITDWRALMVISMTTQSELDAQGLSDLGAQITAAGARWVHLPVADFDIPTPQIARRWPEVSRAAQSILRQGGNVLIHCRGGCGRSGMAALRLMIDSGGAPDVALARLRRARACAIETDAQMRWAMQR